MKDIEKNHSLYQFTSQLSTFDCRRLEKILEHQILQNHLRNAAINFDKNLFDPILETAPGSPSTTTHRRMSVRFDLNGEVLFAGRIASSNYESNPTFIESSRSSEGIHEPLRSAQMNQFVYP